MRSVEAYLQRPEFELYDMENDPHEINNLSGNPEYRSTLDSMILKIKNFQLQTRDPWLIMWENESVFQGTGVNLYCEIQV
jgi:N-sulfoglucosamine sulfohydrolase